jgi:hypothetical protein
MLILYGIGFADREDQQPTTAPYRLQVPGAAVLAVQAVYIYIYIYIGGPFLGRMLHVVSFMYRRV